MQNLLEQYFISTTVTCVHNPYSFLQFLWFNKINLIDDQIIFMKL